MYESYYGLNRLPFENVLDTSFYYPSYGHRETLSAVIYAINQKKGLVVVAGHPGTGKSFLMKLVKEHLPVTDYVIEVKSRMDLVKGLTERLEDFLSIKGSEDFSQYRQDKLAARLEELGKRGGRIVLLIDEAQTLNEEELEYIRLLWNIESSDGKLIQTILFGQKELLDLLSRKSMQATLQRVQVFRVLKGLGLQETTKYIEKRLQAAGSNEKIFTRDSIRLIHKLSRGHLRMINQLCDQGMMSAYVAEETYVGEKQVKAIIAENPIFSEVHDLDDAALPYYRNGDISEKAGKISEIDTKHTESSNESDTIGNSGGEHEEGARQSEDEESKQVELEQNWSEVTGETVVATEGKTRQHRLIGMVMGAVVIGLIWIAVEMLQGQQSVKELTPPKETRMEEAKQVPQVAEETAEEIDSGPLFTIGKLDPLVPGSAEEFDTGSAIQAIESENSPESRVKDNDSSAQAEQITALEQNDKIVKETSDDEHTPAARIVPESAVSTTVTKVDAVSETEIKSETTKTQSTQATPENANPSSTNVTPLTSKVKTPKEEVKVTASSETDVGLVVARAETPKQRSDTDGYEQAVSKGVTPVTKEKADIHDSVDSSGKKEVTTRPVTRKVKAPQETPKLIGVNRDIPFPYMSADTVNTEDVEIAEGESVSRLAVEKYGAWNLTLEDILTQLNPKINNMDVIQVDSVMKFPLFKPEQLIVQNKSGKFFLYLKTVDLDKVKAERKIYQELGAAVRLQEVILRGNRKIRLYLGPMSDESLVRDWLQLVRYDFAPLVLNEQVAKKAEAK